MGNTLEYILKLRDQLSPGMNAAAKSVFSNSRAAGDFAVIVQDAPTLTLLRASQDGVVASASAEDGQFADISELSPATSRRTCGRAVRGLSA